MSIYKSIPAKSRLTESKLASAQEYNRNRAESLFDLSCLPYPLRLLDPSSAGFALMVQFDQLDASLKPDGRLGPDTLSLYPGAKRKDSLSDGGYVYGVDVSRYQGRINWSLVKSDGNAFAIIKATEGVGYTDPKLRDNAFGAHAAGLDIGYYHFPTPGTNGEWDPVDEANWFLQQIEDLPHPNLGVALDLEEDEENLSRQKYTAWCEEWLKVVEHHFKGHILIYTSANKEEELLTREHQLGRYPLWNPRYSGDLDIGPKPTKGWHQWVIWQYTSRADVEGIPSRVDRNKALKDWYLLRRRKNSC